MSLTGPLHVDLPKVDLSGTRTRSPATGSSLIPDFITGWQQETPSSHGSGEGDRSSLLERLSAQGLKFHTALLESEVDVEAGHTAVELECLESFLRSISANGNLSNVTVAVISPKTNSAPPRPVVSPAPPPSSRMPRTPFVALALVGCLYAIRTLRKPIKAAPPINPILAQNRALLAEGGKGFIRTEHIEGLLDPSAPLNEFLNHKRSARLVRLGEVQVMHYPECSGSIILKKFSSLEEAQRSAARLLKASTPRHIVQKMTQTGNETYLLFLARDSLPW